MSHDPTDKAGFEKWARGQGMSLELVGEDLRTRGGIAMPTYFEDNTEYAWRGWANRPHRTTRVSIVDMWPTPKPAEREVRLPSTFEPLPDDAYHGMPRFGEAPPRHAAMSPAFAAPYGVDDKTIESCKARFTYEPMGEGPVIPVEGVAHEPKGEK